MLATECLAEANTGLGHGGPPEGEGLLYRAMPLLASMAKNEGISVNLCGQAAQSDRRKQKSSLRELMKFVCLLQMSGLGNVLLCVPRLFRGPTVCADEAGPNAADIVLRSSSHQKTGTHNITDLYSHYFATT